MDEIDDDRAAELERLRAAITEQEPKLVAAIAAYNATVRAAYEQLWEVGDGFNRVVGEFEDLHSEIVADMDSVLDQAEEDWPETAEGRDFQAWLAAWQGIEESLMGLEAERPRDVKAPKPAYSAMIAALPLRPGRVAATPAGSDPARDQVRSPTIREDWGRIAAFARRAFPEGEFRLAEGATEAEIAAAEAVLRCRLPDDVRESYRVHNGTEETSFAYIGALSPIATVAHHFARRRSLDPDDWGTPQAIQGPIRPVWWDTARIQLTESGAGDGLIVDLDPAEGGTWGQVIHHDHEQGPLRVYARSWGELLRQIADDAEAGRIVYDEDYTWGRPAPGQDDPTPPAGGPTSPQPAEDGDRSGVSDEAPDRPADAEPSAKRSFESTAGGSNKFWEVARDGNQMTTRWGKIGVKGQSKAKSFDTAEAAVAEVAKLIKQKIKEGYVEKHS